MTLSKKLFQKLFLIIFQKKITQNVNQYTKKTIQNINTCQKRPN